MVTELQKVLQSYRMRCHVYKVIKRVAIVLE